MSLSCKKNCLNVHVDVCCSDCGKPLEIEVTGNHTISVVPCSSCQISDLAEEVAKLLEEKRKNANS